MSAHLRKKGFAVLIVYMAASGVLILTIYQLTFRILADNNIIMMKCSPKCAPAVPAVTHFDANFNDKLMREPCFSVENMLPMADKCHCIMRICIKVRKQFCGES